MPPSSVSHKSAWSGRGRGSTSGHFSRGWRGGRSWGFLRGGARAGSRPVSVASSRSRGGRGSSIASQSAIGRSSVSTTTLSSDPSLPPAGILPSIEQRDTPALLEQQSGPASARLTANNHGSAAETDLCDLGIVMAVDLSDSNSLGCAYLDVEQGHLFLLSGGSNACVEDVERLILMIRPKFLLSSARASEQLTQYLEEETGKAFTGTSILPPFSHRIVVPASFSPDSAQDRLLKLLPQTPSSLKLFENSAEVGDDVHLSTLIDIREVMSIGCAGAVIGDYQRMLSAGMASSSGLEGKRMTSISMFSLADIMYISADSLHSLQIIRSEGHPSGQGICPGAAQGSKESLSLLGLIQPHASTQQGKARLRQLLVKPSTNIEVIESSHRSIAIFCLSENTEVLKEARSVLKGLCNVPAVLTNLQIGVDTSASRGSINRGVWASLMQFSFRVASLRECIGRLVGADKVPAVQEFERAIHSQDIMRVGQRIQATVDFDKPSTTLKATIAVGVDAVLDEARRKYYSMDSVLVLCAAHITRRMPEHARRFHLGCRYVPQLGFFSLVSRNQETGEAEYDGRGWDGNDAPWFPQCQEDTQVFCKNEYMLEMDRRFGDIYGEIRDREIELIHELAKEVLEFKDVLISASDACGKLDATMALASVAVKYRWTQPRMTDESCVRIRNGVHPLQTLTVPVFIPNDCSMGTGATDEAELRSSAGSSQVSSSSRGEAAPSMLVLTGPNHSGKSVYLKQVALIIYLAHVGSFVPAEQATIGVVDKLLTRISTRESVSGAESAFGHDLRQMSFIVRAATSRSLVVVDEFGKGTRSDDGASLMAALLDRFHGLGRDSPRTLVATHFHEVFECSLLGRQTAEIACAHMDVRMATKSDGTNEEFTYLYTLQPGRCTSSYGIVCAELNGVAPLIIARANELALMLAQNKRLDGTCAQVSPEEEEILKAAERVSRRLMELEPHVLNDLEGGFETQQMLRYLLSAADSP